MLSNQNFPCISYINKLLELRLLASRNRIPPKLVWVQWRIQWNVMEPMDRKYWWVHVGLEGCQALFHLSLYVFIFFSPFFPVHIFPIFSLHMGISLFFPCIFVLSGNPIALEFTCHHFEKHQRLNYVSWILILNS